MSQRPSFDMGRLSTATKILAGAGLLYFIDLFLPWQHLCVSLGPFGKACGSVSGWHGVGLLNGILVILILVMESLIIAGVKVDVGTPAMRNQVEAGLAGGVLLFTIIKVLVNHQSIYLWSWIGLVLAVIIAYGGGHGGGGGGGAGTRPPPGPPPPPHTPPAGGPHTVNPKTAEELTGVS